MQVFGMVSTGKGQKTCLSGFWPVFAEEFGGIPGRQRPAFCQSFPQLATLLGRLERSSDSTAGSRFVHPPREKDECFSAAKTELLNCQLPRLLSLAHRLTRDSG